MRGGALPPALLAAAMGFALSFAPRKAVAPSLAAFVVMAVAASLIRADPTHADGVFYACWASVVATALWVHVARRFAASWTIMLAANAGFWAGAVIGVAGQPLDLARALPWILLFLPSAWLIGRRLGLGVKVVASWLIAVSVLAAALPATTQTPGYVGDHME